MFRLRGQDLERYNDLPKWVVLQLASFPYNFLVSDLSSYYSATLPGTEFRDKYP